MLFYLVSSRRTQFSAAAGTITCAMLTLFAVSALAQLGPQPEHRRANPLPPPPQPPVSHLITDAIGNPVSGAKLEFSVDADQRHPPRWQPQHWILVSDDAGWVPVSP